MDKINADPQLERLFLELLQTADPSVADHPELTHEFAEHLAALSEDWATGTERFGAHVQFLRDWVESNSLAHSEIEVSANAEFSSTESADAWGERELADFEAEG
jgi:hypothetical protein